MYALNVKKGTTVNHPEITLTGGLAMPINDKLANQLKHVVNVVVFDGVAGINEDKRIKEIYGVDRKTLNRPTELRTYQSFVAEYRDVTVAGRKWHEYQKEMGIKEND